MKNLPITDRDCFEKCINNLGYDDQFSIDEKLFRDGNSKNFSLLIESLKKHKITISSNRFDNGYVIKKKFQQNNNDSEVFIFFQYADVLYDIYSQFSEKISFNEFQRAFFKKSVDACFFDFIEQQQISNDEIRVLLFTIANFFKGEQPVILSDAKLSPNGLLKITQIYLEGIGKNIEQDLLKIQIDHDGISVRLTLTKRAVELMQGKTIDVYDTIPHKDCNFYTLVNPKLITNVELYYEESGDKLFKSLKRLILNDSYKSNCLSVLLHGPSGSGKTEFVYQLSKQVNAKIMQADYSKIVSKWIGDTEKNIKKLFTTYEQLSKHSKTPIILLLNEADGLMNKRVSIKQSNDIHSNQAQVQLLEMLEKFKGILIATSNMPKNIDQAFYRRFLFKVNLTLPGLKSKEWLIQNSTIRSLIPDEMIPKIIANEWSPAQLVNLETKIKLLNSIDFFNQNDIQWLLTEEGMLNSQSSIGFKQTGTN